MGRSIRRSEIPADMYSRLNSWQPVAVTVVVQELLLVAQSVGQQPLGRTAIELLQESGSKYLAEQAFVVAEAQALQGYRSYSVRLRYRSLRNRQLVVTAKIQFINN